MRALMLIGLSVTGLGCLDFDALSAGYGEVLTTVPIAVDGGASDMEITQYQLDVSYCVQWIESGHTHLTSLSECMCTAFYFCDDMATPEDMAVVRDLTSIADMTQPIDLEPALNCIQVGNSTQKCRFDGQSGMLYCARIGDCCMGLDEARVDGVPMCCGVNPLLPYGAKTCHAYTTGQLCQSNEQCLSAVCSNIVNGFGACK